MAASCLGRGSCALMAQRRLLWKVSFPRIFLPVSLQYICIARAQGQTQKEEYRSRVCRCPPKLISTSAEPAALRILSRFSDSMNALPSPSQRVIRIIIAVLSSLEEVDVDSVFSKIASISNGTVISHVSYLPSIVVLFWAEYLLGWSAGLPLLRSWIKCLERHHLWIIQA